MADRLAKPGRKRGANGLWLAAAALFALVLILLLSQRPRVVFDEVGEYGRVRVTENAAGLRTLYTGEGRARQSVIRPGDPLHLELPYTRVASIGLALVPPDAHILYVGLGGGAMPMHARQVLPRATIDVVEIDPLIVHVAQEHFGFRPDSLLRVHTADGRALIEAAAVESWDLIVLDAFSDDAIPHSLATREFLEVVHSRLRPSGVVLSNLWTANDAYASMLATYRSVFAAAHLLHVPNRRQVVLIASRPLGVVTRDTLVAAARRSDDALLESIVRNGYEALSATRATVLTDSMSVIHR
ncbi:MAG TPA: fused MFS/spermidine synthase [Longimicrobiales bacterium]|nr:fused MFS/spermidine synthase [Longimicrobiales bacterium]